MCDYADDFTAMIQHAVDYGEKYINHVQDSWLWRDIEGVVRHLKSMDSCHLVNLKGFIEGKETCNHPLMRSKVMNIEKVLIGRGYTAEQYLKDTEMYESGNRPNVYSNEVYVESGRYVLGSGIDSECWWEKYDYVLEKPTDGSVGVV